MNYLSVCHIATLTRWGGVESMLEDFLTNVDHVRVRHILITTSSRPEITQAIKNAGIEVFEPKRRFHYDPGIIIQMAKWLCNHNVKIVHSYNAYANAWGNMAALFAGTPVYLTYEHGTIWNSQFPVAWMDCWANQRANLVIANSQASARFLEFKYRVPKKKIRVVYNAVPNIQSVDFRQVRAQLGIDQDKLVVGSIGRLDTPKDFATFVDAADRVLKKRKDVIFILVGGGPLEKELQAMVLTMRIQDRFLMTGWRKDARTLLQAFDVFVSTSIREPFGNVLIEAALCEKPVIAPSIDGIPEAVVQGETGVLLRPSKSVRKYWSPGAAPVPKHVIIDDRIQSPRSLDPEVLAENILRILDDKDLRLRFGKKAKKRAQSLFSMERYINDLESIYLERSK